MKIILLFLWGLISLIDKNFFMPVQNSFNRVRNRLRKRNKKPSNTKKESTYYTRLWQWVLKNETKRMKETRILFTARENENQRIESSSVLNIYDTIRLYLLTDRWDPVLKFSPPMLAVFPFLLVNLAPFYLLNESAPISIISVLMLLIGIFVFTATLKQIESGSGKGILWLIFAASFLYWIFTVIPLLPSEANLQNFVVLANFVMGGLLSIVSFMASILQWRLFYVAEAVSNWALYAMSPNARGVKVSQIAAWLVFLAPNGKDLYGMTKSSDVEFLSEINRIEREGIDRRIVLISILAFVGISQVGDLSFFSKINNDAIKLLTDAFPSFPTIPAIFSIFSITSITFAVIFVGLIFSGILLEIWLSEFPNRILGLACSYAKQYISSSDREKEGFFLKFRVVNTKRPETIMSKDGIPYWILIAKQQMQNGEWKCLLQANIWLDTREENSLEKGNTGTST